MALMQLKVTWHAMAVILDGWFQHDFESMKLQQFGRLLSAYRDCGPRQELTEYTFFSSLVPIAILAMVICLTMRLLWGFGHLLLCMSAAWPQRISCGVHQTPLRHLVLFPVTAATVWRWNAFKVMSNITACPRADFHSPKQLTWSRNVLAISDSWAKF